MRELFRQNSESSGGCPGEANCEDYSCAFGSTREEKEEAVCLGCPLLPTKGSRTRDARFKNVCEAVERLRNERRAGRIDLNQVSPLLWEGLIIWLDFESHFERLARAETTDLLKAFLGMQRATA